MPKQEAGAGATCPSRLNGHKWDILCIWLALQGPGPPGAGASRSRGLRSSPHRGTERQGWRLQQLAGPSAHCTEWDRLPGAQSTCARAAPWVSAEPQSLGGALNLRGRAGLPGCWPCPAGPVQQVPGVWLDQDGRNPAFRGASTRKPPCPSTLPSGAPPRGDATQKGNRGLERRWDLQDSLVAWPWTQASYWGSFCPSRGLPRTPAAGPVWAPPWSTSQPRSPSPQPLGQHVCPVGLLALGTLSLRGYETHTYKGHRPFAHKMGRLGCVTSGWVSGLTQVSCALSRARTQFRHFCLVKRHLWAQVIVLTGAGPRHPAYIYSIL